MNAFLLLSLELLISLAASLAVLRVLAGPLLRTLQHLCPDEQSASFWLSYTRIMLVIAPLMLVLLIDAFSDLDDPLGSLRLGLLATLGGLLLGMHILGSRMGRFIRPPAAAVEQRT